MNMQTSPRVLQSYICGDWRTGSRDGNPLLNASTGAVVALIVVVITLFVSVIIAYVVTRYRIPGKTAMIGSMLYAYMFPPLLLAIPLLSIFAKLGLADHLIAVVLAHCTLTIPLGVWMLWGFFKVMPFDLGEAAMVDGCSRAGALVTVVLPGSVPGLIAKS